MRFSGGAAAAIATAFTIFACNADAQSLNPTIAGTLDAGWSRFTTPGRSTDDLSGGGAAVLTLDNPGLNVQLNLDNDELQQPAIKPLPGGGGAYVPSATSDVWSYGGDIFWRDYAGSVGINADFLSATVDDTGGRTASFATYGWFGQFFALPDLTLESKAGRIEGNYEGWYGDVAAVYYLMPDLALEPGVDLGTLEHHVGRQLKDASLSFEYLPVREIPVSMSLGYEYADYSQFHPERVNIFLVGLKVYLGGGGRNGTLVDHQRNGTTNWDGAPPSLLGLGF